MQVSSMREAVEYVETALSGSVGRYDTLAIALLITSWQAGHLVIDEGAFWDSVARCDVDSPVTKLDECGDETLYSMYLEGLGHPISVLKVDDDEFYPRDFEAWWEMPTTMAQARRFEWVSEQELAHQ